MKRGFLPAMRFPTDSAHAAARRRMAMAGVAGLAVVAYARAVLNGYAMDDVEILRSPLLHSMHTLPATLISPWWPAGELYRPLTLFSLGLDQLLGNGSAWLPQVINVLLHALVCALVTRLYARVLPLAGAVAGGVVFALLPAHVEAVASVVGRAELLSALALTVLMAVVTTDHPPTRRTRLTVAALAALALASKEGGIAAPVLAFAAAWARPEQRRHAKVWTLSALAGTVALLLARLDVLGTLGGDRAHPAFRTISAGARVKIALSLLPRMLELLLLPMVPVIDASPPAAEVLHPSPFLVAVGLLLVGAASAALWVHLRRPTAWTLGIVIAATTIAPTTNLFFASGVLLAARNLYAPSIGAGMLIGAAVATLGTMRLRRVIPYAVAAFAALAFVVTWREVPVWRSSDAVMTAMIEREPGNYRVPMFRAYSARDAGRTEESLALFRVAVARFPLDWEMLTDGATMALRMHDTTTAVQWLQLAIDAHVRVPRARTRLVAIVVARGDTARATRLLIDGVRDDPSQRGWAAMLERLKR